LYFVFSDQLQKYLIKVFQIHFFKSILYLYLNSPKSVFYNTGKGRNVLVQLHQNDQYTNSLLSQLAHPWKTFRVLPWQT